MGLRYTQALYHARHSSQNPNSATGSFLENTTTDNFFPEPLRKLAGQASKTQASLQAQEIIKLTNTERSNNGKKTLTENAKLSLAAHRKIQDMINLQYFEHKSPTGKGPADIIEATGYAYVIVGENLAEGDFADNQDLVQGWMNSPGHRANILNDKYTEIGVAAEQGILHGQKVWFAVQEFGRPLTDCPAIDQDLKNQITANENQVKMLQADLDKVQAQMSYAKQQNDIDTYNSLVPQHNSLANQINTLVEKTKQIVTAYNNQVKSFNTCIE